MRFFLFLLTLFCLSSCGGAGKLQERAFLMNTEFTAVLYYGKGEAKAREDIQAAFTLVKGLEEKYSVTIPESWLYRLNQSGRAELDSESGRILNDIRRFHGETEGAFDPSVYPVVRLWGFQTPKQRVPDDAEITTALRTVGWGRKVRLSEGLVELDRGSGLDFGGLLKGYAVDRAVGFLKSKGYSAGLVNAGGNLRVFGTKPDQTPWVIGIRHPRKEGDVIALVTLTNGQAIATSGDYERYFITNGVRYHHLMDPKTGRPSRNGWISVSVIAPDAETADAYSTGLFILGLRRGIELADSRNYPVFAVTEGPEGLSLTNNLYWKSYEGK